MFRASCVRREVQSGINAGRQRLAQQFATMDGWQTTQDSRFDHYIKEKRKKEYYDAFDQRVERAFRTVAKTHKAEVMNAFKRKVKGKDGAKWTAAVMLEAKNAVEERVHWLREVWMQIDADYRSQDPTRQRKAAKEISDALRGEPGAYMEWVYHHKRDARFAGPQEKAELDAELAAAELPDVSDEEVNRFHNLKLNMSDIERNVKSRFGVAGYQHWAELQRMKDEEYDVKLDDAAKVYEELLDQSSRYDESRRTALLRSNVERVHEAQVRFKAAMALEDEREQLVEAHEAMKEDRKRQAKERRIELLREAAEMKQQGASPEAIQQHMRQKQLDEHARRQSEYQLQERETVVQKKKQYLSYIDELKDTIERREGEELLGRTHDTQDEEWKPMMEEAQRQKKAAPALNVFGFADEDRLENGEERSAMASFTAQDSPQEGEATADAAMTSSTAGATSMDLKKKLWEAVNSDHYEDPRRTVHQARLDAAETYDPLYSTMDALSLRQGRKYLRQGTGDMAAGGGMDKHVFKHVSSVELPYRWGVQSHTVHDLDSDGSKDYFFAGKFHVRDPETGDIDWRYEAKKGGAVFRGPRFYRLGEKREAKDPGLRTMEPSPAHRRRPASPPKLGNEWRSE